MKSLLPSVIPVLVGLLCIPGRASGEAPLIPAAMEGWTLKVDEDAKAEMKVIPDGWDGQPALRIEVQNAPTGKIWLVRASSPTFAVEAGVDYYVSFWAKLEGPPKSVFVTMGADGKKLAPERKVPIDDFEWKEYSCFFRPDKASATARISFANLAQQDLIVQIANVTIAKD